MDSEYKFSARTLKDAQPYRLPVVLSYIYWLPVGNFRKARFCN